MGKVNRCVLKQDKKLAKEVRWYTLHNKNDATYKDKDPVIMREQK